MRRAPSSRPARAHGLRDGRRRPRAGARCRAGTARWRRRSPRPPRARPIGAARCAGGPGAACRCGDTGVGSVVAVPEIPVLRPQEAVLAAISPGGGHRARARRLRRVRRAAAGRCRPKVYLDVAPHGDFRAMPAKGGGLAILKWVTSFPGNPAAGLPVVMGMICVSSAVDGEPLALVDVRCGNRSAHRCGGGGGRAGAGARGRADGRASSAAGCTAPGRPAAWRPPSTGRACASTPIPRRAGRARRRARLGGRQPARTRWPATS